MRHVSKNGISVPSVLRSDRTREAQSQIEQVLRLDDALRKTRRVPIDQAIFLDQEVQGKLRRLFAKKCAYCETFLTADDNVDHFRPISNAAGANSDSVHHYSWLAYEWQNILPVCSACVSSKQNLFPIEGDRAPLLSTIDEVRRIERAGLLDPTIDKPERHLLFDFSGACFGTTARGVATVDAVGLNRSSLAARRAEQFRHLKSYMAGLGDSIEALPSINRFVASYSEFSGAASILVYAYTQLVARRVGERPPTFVGIKNTLSRYARTVDREILVSALKMIDEDIHERRQRNASKNEISEIAEYRLAASPGEYRSYSLAIPTSIRRIEIRNFKAIEHLVVELPRRRPHTKDDAACLMLLGENAAGKSSILEAIALAVIGPREANRLSLAPSDYLRRRDGRRWQLVEAQPSHISVSFYENEVPAEIRIDEVDPSTFEGEAGPLFSISAYGAHRFFGQKKPVNSRIAAVRGLFKPQTVLPDPGHWLRTLSENDFAAVARALREILVLKFNDDIVRDEKLGICVRAHGQLTPLDRLSEGYRSIFATTIDAMRILLQHTHQLETAGGIVLIDEIETHLHPRWKLRIMGALRKALPRVQFIVTTHDPLCVRGMEAGEVQVVLRDEEQRIALLSDLPDPRALTAEQLLTSDYFGLNSTADLEAELSVARYVDRLIERSAGSTEAGQSLLDSIFIGDRPEQQLAVEALKKYLESRRGGGPEARTQARHDALDAFFAALEAAEPNDSRR